VYRGVNDTTNSALLSKNFNKEKFTTYEKMLVDYVYEVHVKVVNRKSPEEIFRNKKKKRKDRSGKQKRTTNYKKKWTC
jgi:hypothetical protein